MNRLRQLLFNEKFTCERIDHSILHEPNARLVDILQQKNPSIVILWNWSIGGKWDAFIEKTALIHKYWLHTTHKIIIASEITRQHNITPEIINSIAKAVAQYFSDAQVLVVRSSWQWDAQWVWIYHSELINNNPIRISEAIHKVIHSNYSTNAQAYRQKIWAQWDDFWVIIEPCIGTLHTNEKGDSCILPLFSGWARSSKQFDIDMWINFWVWWWVSEQKYLYVKNKDFYDIKNFHPIWSLIDKNNPLFYPKKPYNGYKKYIINHVFHSDPKLWNSFLQVWKREIHTKAYNIDKDRCKSETIHYENIWTLYDKFKYTTNKLYNFLKKNPWTYIEWASQLWDNQRDDNQKVFITQIGNNNTIHERQNTIPWTQKVIDFQETIGTWTQSFSQIVIIKRPFDNYVKELENISAHYNNYLLCIAENCTLWDRKLPFTAFANAWSIIEFCNPQWHIWTPAWHYMWLLDAGKILFSATSNNLYKLTSSIETIMISEEKINDYLSLVTLPENTLFVQQEQKTGQWSVSIKKTP
jgi:hypothetical protein